MELPAPHLYVPFKAGPFRMAMGLNELDLNEWIEIDSNYPAEMAQKKILLAEQPASVFAALPGSDSSGREVLELLSEHLARRFPAYFLREDSFIKNLIRNESWNLSDTSHHQLDVAARLVQEDLCLMQPRNGVFCLTAASVCFPSRWKLHEKMGLPLSAIHEPVPFFDKIAGASDRYLNRMTADKAVWRMNWSLHDTPELFQPVAASPAHSGPITIDNASEHLWLRMERQTLRRLPLSGDILFTIRTYVRPITEFTNTASELASALRNLPPQTLDYKGLSELSQIAIAWLEKQCGASGR